MSSIAPPVPSKNGTAAVRIEGDNYRRDKPPDNWRNSLVAIDDESGHIVGVLAHGVQLSSSDRHDSRRIDAESCHLQYATAHIYHDDEVRPASGPGSVLREDTFAPPPVPSKALHHHLSAPDTRTGVEGTDINEEDVHDGKIKVALAHVETHRPELLRDRDFDTTKCHGQEGSGSTVGGPVVQLWKKAKGVPNKYINSKVENKRAGEDAGIVTTHKESVQNMNRAEYPMLHAPSKREKSKAEVIKQSTLWDDSPTKSVMSHRLPGHSVLIDFLSGSRISATIIDVLNPTPLGATKEPERLEVRTPVAISEVARSDILSYIPLLPAHVLSFFGRSGDESNQTAASTESQITSRSYAGDHLLNIAKCLSPSSLIGSAANALSSVGSSFTSWLGSASSSSIPTSKTDDLASKGHIDDEWEWTISEYDPNSLDGTPRPIYRRRKIVPSPKGLFNARHRAEQPSLETQNRYCIVHFDEWGIVRRAFTKM